MIPAGAAVFLCVLGALIGYVVGTAIHAVRADRLKRHVDTLGGSAQSIEHLVYRLEAVATRLDKATVTQLVELSEREAEIAARVAKRETATGRAKS